MCIATANVFASNDTIKIEYKSLYEYIAPEEDPKKHEIALLRSFLDVVSFLGVDYRKVVITGNINKKNFVTTTHIVRNGKDSIVKTNTSYFPMSSDTLEISIKTLPVDSHKVKTELTMNLGKNILSYPFTYDIESNKSCMLIETAIEKGLEYDDNSGAEYYLTTSEVFPIIAYSMGIPLDNGTIHYCGLKNSGVHPKLWFEKFKIKNYVYFEIKFLD